MHAAAGGTAYRPAPDAACTCTAPSRRFAIKKDTEPYCALVKDLWTKGHEIALHTYDHVRLDPPIDEEKKSEPASQSIRQLGSRGWASMPDWREGSCSSCWVGVRGGRRLGCQRACMPSASPAGHGSSRLALPRRLRLPSPMPLSCPAHVCF